MSPVIRCLHLSNTHMEYVYKSLNKFEVITYENSVARSSPIGSLVLTLFPIDPAEVVRFSILRLGTTRSSRYWYNSCVREVYTWRNTSSTSVYRYKCTRWRTASQSTGRQEKRYTTRLPVPPTPFPSSLHHLLCCTSVSQIFCAHYTR